MQLSITGRSVDVTDNIKAHINEKLERCLSVFPRVESVHVILDFEKHLHVAEVVVQAANHIHVAAIEKCDNMYKSIDLSIDHVERQLRKLRDKVQDHRK